MRKRLSTVSGFVFSIAVAGALVLAAVAAQPGTGFAQDRSTASPNSAGQNPAQGEAQPQNEQQSAQGKEQSKKDHLKKWSGKLVDLPCMEKALASAGAGTRSTGAPEGSSPEPPAGQPTRQQLFGAQGQGAGQNPPTGSTAPGIPGQTPQYPPGQSPYPGQTQGPNQFPSGPTPAEKQAPLCPATSATTSFGLVLSDGKFVRLDESGNSKAGEALKTTEVKELKKGKPPKAQVKGTLEGETISVAELRVKGQRP